MSVLYDYTFTRRRISDGLPQRCDTPEFAYEYVRDLLFEESERLVVVVLNRKHRAIGRETLYKGTVSGAPVRPAEAFRPVCD